MTSDINREDLEKKLQRLIDIADAKGIPSEYGFFGPTSMVWKVGQESMLFFGSAYALWMQDAHPWVGTGAHEHSKVKTDPFGRWERTFEAVNAMMMGDRETALKYSRMVHNIHTKVYGNLKNGEAYAANNSEAMLWVGATLAYTAIMLYELFVDELTSFEKEQYYQEFKMFFDMFGIDSSIVPKDWESFLTYYESKTGELEVNDHAREMVGFFLKKADILIGPLSLPVDAVLAFSVSLLPRTVRKQYGFRYGFKEKMLAQGVMTFLRTFYPLIPLKWRQNVYYVNALEVAKNKAKK